VTLNLAGMRPACTILFITHSSGLYGAERCLLDLVSGLPKRIRPVVMAPGAGPLVDKLKEKEIEICLIPFRGWWHRKYRIKCVQRIFLNMVALGRMTAEFRRREINLVYSNSLYSPVGAIFARMRSLPHIWHAHELAALHDGMKFDFGEKYAMEFVDKRSGAVICNSHAHQNNLSEWIAATKIKMVYNGIAPEDSASVREGFRKRVRRNETTILNIGSITENKGQMDAILALQELLKNGQKARLILLGDGDSEYGKYLKKIAGGLPCRESVKWEGFQENTQKYLQEADVLIVCSKLETFGRSAVEAMAAGCPVVASKTGVIPEIIEDGVNGFTYHHGDYRELSAKIRLLMQDEELRSRVSENAYETYLRNFQLRDYVHHVVEIIDETRQARCRETLGPCA